MKRARRWILLALLTVVASVAIGVVLMSVSANGSRWLVERAIVVSGASIEVLGLDGTLLNGMRADTLRVRIDDTTIEVKMIELVPAWAASLARDTFVIDRLTAAALRVTSNGTTEPSPIAIALPVLPFALDIRALRVDRTELNDVPSGYAPAIRGRFAYDGAAYSLRQINFQAAAYRIEGDLEVAANEEIAVNGALTWHLTEPLASGRMEFGDSLRQLVVALRVDEPMAVDARGTVRVLGEMQPRFEFDGTLAEWISEQVRVSGLAVHVAGTLDRFEVQGTAAVNVPELPSARVLVDAAGSLDVLDIRRLSLTSEHGGAVAQGRVARTPVLSVDLAMDVNDLDPALFAPWLSGVVSGHLDLGIRAEDLDITIRSLAGRLNEAPFEAAGQIARTAGKWTARDVEVRSGPNHATLALEWQDDRVAGQARLDMPNLATLLPQVEGDLSANIRVSGRRDAPDIDISADSKQLRYLEWRTANARIDASAKAGKTGDARVTIERVARYDLQFDRIDAVVRGSLDRLTGTLGWNVAEQRGAMQLSAHRDGDQWNVLVAEGAQLTLPTERWRLDRDVKAIIADGAFSVSSHCWLPPLGGGRVCVDAASADGGHIRLAGAVDDLQIATLASHFEDAQRLSGTLVGRWDVAADAGHWRGSAGLKTKGLRLIGDGQAGAVDGIELPVLSAAVELADDRARVTVQADSGVSRVVDLALNIDGFDASAALDGRATVSVDDLGFIATFTRRVGELNGTLSGDFVIGGTVAAPDLRGTLAVVGARVVLTEPRVELTSLDLTMQLSGVDEWTIRGSAQSDKGSVSLDGTLFAPLSDARALRARIDATDLPVSIPDVTVRVAGGIDIDWQPGLVAVKGRVEIPRAEVTLSELPPGAVAVSDDVVVINRS